MTEAQRKWLEANPDFEPVGRPRPGVKFRKFGTLYADGSYIPSEPMRPIVLEDGCFGIGVREHHH